MELNKDSLKINLEEVVKGTTKFIKNIVEEAFAEGVVIGLSGGLDSSFAATLCTRALCRENVLGILLPTDFTPKEDIEDAFEISKILGIRTKLVNVQNVLESFCKSLRIGKEKDKFRMARANVLARIRMIILYFYANTNNYLVVGTGDKSENLIGYFTKHGDGAADFFPIRHLYKTQIKELSLYLKLPKKIVYKPSSPQLYPGHKAIDEIPIDYDMLDLLLVGLFDYKMPPVEVSNATGISLEKVIEVQNRFNKTMHKR